MACISYLTHQEPRGYGVARVKGKGHTRDHHEIRNGNSQHKPPAAASVVLSLHGILGTLFHHRPHGSELLLI